MLKYRSHGNKKQRKEYSYPWKASGTQESPARYPYFHWQPLNEVWEGVDPGSTPSWDDVHLSSPGLAQPSHQMLNHCFKAWLSISTMLTSRLHAWYHFLCYSVCYIWSTVGSVRLHNLWSQQITKSPKKQSKSTNQSKQKFYFSNLKCNISNKV